MQNGGYLFYLEVLIPVNVFQEIFALTNNRNGQVEFIHSCSGMAKGVTVSELGGYYETRGIKKFPTVAN